MKRNKFLFNFFSLLFLFACVSSRSEIIADFSGGMNTVSGPFQVAANELYTCHNWILDNPVGGLTVRPGYRKVTDSLSNHIRIRGIYAYRFYTGQSHLFQVLEKDVVDPFNPQDKLCDLWVSKSNKYEKSDSLWGELYPVRPQFASSLDRQYLFNGKNRPLVIDNGRRGAFRAAPMIPAGPGQADVVPYARAGNLNGEYIWAIATRIPCNSTTWAKRAGTYSVPVVCKNERAIVRGFTQIQADSLCALPANPWYLILRTKANKTDIIYDSLFIIDSVQLPNGQGGVYYDNTHDSLLTTARFYKHLRHPSGVDGGIPSWSWSRGGQNTAFAHGSLTLLHADTGSKPLNDVILGDTIGSCAPGEHSNNFYVYSYMDRFTGVQSDTSRMLSVFRVDSDKNITLGIAKPPSGRYWRVLYRANYTTCRTILEPIAERGHTGFENNVVFYAIDTLRDSLQTVWFDTLTPTKLELRNDDYARNLPETFLSGGIFHEGRMVGFDHQLVYVSAPDTPGVFPFVDTYEFDMDDGDRNMGIASYEGYVVLYRQKSIWILHTSNGTVVDRSKASYGRGLASAAALARYSGVNVFLGYDGVSAESDNLYKANAADRKYLSDPIRNLLVRPAASMQQAVAAVLNDQYWVSYPGTDTTFVYFFKPGGWGTYSFDFDDAVAYDTVSTGNQPFRDLVFVKNDDERLFVFDGTDTSDAGTAFTATGEKRYIGLGKEERCSVDKSRLWVTSTASATTKLGLEVLDENNVRLDSVGFDSLATLSVQTKSLAAGNNANAAHCALKVTAPNRKQLTVNGIELVVSSSGPDRRRP